MGFTPGFSKSRCSGRVDLANHEKVSLPLLFALHAYLQVHTWRYAAPYVSNEANNATMLAKGMPAKGESIESDLCLNDYAWPVSMAIKDATPRCHATDGIHPTVDSTALPTQQVRRKWISSAAHQFRNVAVSTSPTAERERRPPEKRRSDSQFHGALHTPSTGEAEARARSPKQVWARDALDRRRPSLLGTRRVPTYPRAHVD